MAKLVKFSPELTSDMAFTFNDLTVISNALMNAQGFAEEQSLREDLSKEQVQTLREDIDDFSSLSQRLDAYLTKFCGESEIKTTVIVD